MGVSGAVTAHVSGIDLQTAGTVLFVVASWRMPAGDRTRVSLDYGPGRPSIPTTTRTTAP